MNKLLPIFVKVENQRCLVVGGGKVAIQKINQLLECRADITVISPDIVQSISLLPVKSLNRRYESRDMDDFQLIIAATNDEEINQRVYKDAKDRGIPVNVVDQPNLCSFYMGSTYQDGDLKISISTNAKCPSFGVYLRDHIKNISKDIWGASLDQLAVKREKIVRKLSSYKDKKDMMKKIISYDPETNIGNSKKRGKVFIVGAGPGDPELITAKGLRAIQTADVILHDALIHPYLVFEINPIAKKIFVGKRRGKHSINQETIHLIMLKEVANGKNIVRLKGGDPFIFGRGGEEMQALAKENIPFEVIPGISAGLGAAAGFGIPLTHRDEASSTLFITGHQCSESNSQDWKNIAKLNSTLVFYMGSQRLNEIADGLLENGKPQDTPIAIVQNATLKNQNITTSTLGLIKHDIKKKKTLTPTIIIIGNVVSYHERVQKCLESVTCDMVDPLGDVDFDIWKDRSVIA